MSPVPCPLLLYPAVCCRGLILGFTQALQFLSCAVCLSVGGPLYYSGDISLDQLFK